MGTNAETSPHVRASMIKARCGKLRVAVTNFIDGTYDTSIALEKLGAGGFAEVIDSAATQMLSAIATFEAEADALLAEANEHA